MHSRCQTAAAAEHTQAPARTSFHVRALLALRAASTAAWNWCSLTSVDARRPQEGMREKMTRDASYRPSSKHLRSTRKASKG